MKFTAIPQPQGGYKIEAVPIFKLGTHKGFPYTQEWFAKAKANAAKFETQDGYVPSVIIGHNVDPKIEKAEVAQFTNLRLDATGNIVLSDYLVETDGALELFNKFPHRSVEVFNDEAFFSRVAQLGGSEPYHKLPPLKVDKAELFSAETKDPDVILFDDGDDPVSFEGEAELSIDEQINIQELNRDDWQLDDALWSALRAIHDDEAKTPEEKKALIQQRLNEWVGKKLNIENQKVDVMESAADPSAEPPAPETEEFKKLDPQMQKFSASYHQQKSRLAAIEFKESETRARADRDKVDLACKTMTDALIAGPVVNRFRALCYAMIPDHNDNTVRQPDGIVRFNLNSKPAQQPSLKFLLDLMADLVSRKNTGKLFGNEGEPKPYKEDAPTLHASDAEGAKPRNSDAAAAINEELKKRGMPFSDVNFARVQRELIQSGAITLE